MQALAEEVQSAKVASITSTEIVEALARNGFTEDELRRINSVAVARIKTDRRTQAACSAAALRRGDSVVLHGLQAKHNGRSGEVVAVKRTRCDVRMSDTQTVVTVPAHCLRKV